MCLYLEYLVRGLDAAQWYRAGLIIDHVNEEREAEKGLLWFLRSLPGATMALQGPAKWAVVLKHQRPICERAGGWRCGSCHDRPLTSVCTPQPPRLAPRMSSAARMASASPSSSCATKTKTAWMAPTRPTARPPPVLPLIFLATPPPASPACGPATGMTTARMARTSGLRTARAETLPPTCPAAPAPPWSSTVAVASASIAAGCVMGAPTARTSQMRNTVVRPWAGEVGSTGRACEALKLSNTRLPRKKPFCFG